MLVRKGKWRLALVLLISPSSQAYHNYPWQQDFPAPLSGKGVALVSQQRAHLLKQQHHLQQRIHQVQPVIRWVTQQVEARGLPPLLAFVPLIESSYRLDVVSNAGAAGPWQLMPATATRFTVPITAAFDGRYSLPLATDAALTYLAWLYQFFGKDWLLALAAYNAGEGRVLRAVLDANSRHIWDLKLPTETRLYVARIVALSSLLANPTDYQFSLPPWQSGADLQVELRPQQCSLLALATSKGVSMNAASFWNPAWQLPQAAGISHCPFVYSAHSKPTGPGSPTSPVMLRKAVSLESLHDPLLLGTAKGLDMERGTINLERQPDPLGLQLKRPPLVP
ncbi:MAG: lytic transglycosylase domain-containing protein [Aeromonas sp.]